MRKTAFIGMMVLIAVFIGGGVSLGVSTAPPPEGGTLPDFTLPAPQQAEHRAYLGLQGEAAFAIPDIKAEVVIIEIFSMYCPHCQREAPEVNRFFERLSADPVLSKKIILIGIGAGNSAYEVEVFRKKYRIAFPLFEDGDFSIHKKILVSGIKGEKGRKKKRCGSYYPGRPGKGLPAKKA